MRGDRHEVGDDEGKRRGDGKEEKGYIYAR